MSTSPTGPDQAEHTKHGYGWIEDLNLKAMIAQVLDRWPCAGLAVAVVADGNIVWFHGHGWPMLRRRRRSPKTRSFASDRLPKPSLQLR